MSLGAQARVLLRHPAGWIACGFGSGLSPWAPGTTGSLAALLPYLWLARQPGWVHLLACVLGFALGVWASGVAIARLQREDPGVVVIDEWIGLWIAFGVMQLGVDRLPNELPALSTWAWLALGFVCFRATDIAKPWPASWADRQLTGGFGAMLDDALAGVWAGILALALLALAAWLRG
jgi:phosphatidylglycerophosphatase A